MDFFQDRVFRRSDPLAASPDPARWAPLKAPHSVIPARGFPCQNLSAAPWHRILDAIEGVHTKAGAGALDRASVRRATAPSSANPTSACHQGKIKTAAARRRDGQRAHGRRRELGSDAAAGAEESTEGSICLEVF
jgi:hypothetical protein